MQSNVLCSLSTLEEENHGGVSVQSPHAKTNGKGRFQCDNRRLKAPWEKGTAKSLSVEDIPQRLGGISVVHY